MSRSVGMLSDHRHSSHWRSDNPDYYNPHLRLPMPGHQQQQRQQQLQQQQPFSQLRSHRVGSSADADRVRRRINVACLRCRKRKIKCTGPVNNGICQNCADAQVKIDECQYHRVSSKSLDCELGQLGTSSESSISSRTGSSGQIQEQSISNQGFPRWNAEYDAHSQGAHEQGGSYIPFGYNDSVGHLGPRAGIALQSLAPDASLVDQNAYGSKSAGTVISWASAMPSTPAVSPMTGPSHTLADRQLPMPSTSQQQPAEIYSNLAGNHTMTISPCRPDTNCHDQHCTSAAELSSRYVGSPCTLSSRTASSGSEYLHPVMVQGYPSYIGPTEQPGLPNEAIAHSMPAARFETGVNEDYGGYAHVTPSSRSTEMQMYGQMYDPPADPRFSNLGILASTSAVAQNDLTMATSAAESSGWSGRQRHSAAATSAGSLTSTTRHGAR